MKIKLFIDLIQKKFIKGVNFSLNYPPPIEPFFPPIILRGQGGENEFTIL